MKEERLIPIHYSFGRTFIRVSATWLEIEDLYENNADYSSVRAKGDFKRHFPSSKDQGENNSKAVFCGFSQA